MALNKSGLPPMQRPTVRALRPGGAGVVEPKKPSLDLGEAKLGKLPKLKGFRSGGTIPGMGSGLSQSPLPKIPKPPKVGGPKIKGPY